MHPKLIEFLTPAPDSAAARSMRRGKSPWVDAVHLLWSAWVFVVPIWNSDGWSTRWIATTMVSYPLFLMLYYKSVVASRRTVRAYALALVLLSLLLLPWYPSGLTYFIFGCVMLCGSCVALRSYLLSLAWLNGALLLETWLLHFPLQAVFSIPLTSFIIGVIVHAERTNEEKDAQLRLSHEEVRRLAATAERERIGRDLHDLLGHTLSLITLKLELSRKLFDRDVDAAKREVEEAEKVARHALAEVRSAVTGIRATDLAAELASARLLLESSRVHLDYTASAVDMPAEIERGLSLVLREAVTNISRHAAASRVHIELRREHASVCMQINDNGRGGLARDGNGMSGMRERICAMGGTLSVESPLGGGTQLRVLVPVPVLRLVGSTRAAPASTAAHASSGYPAA